MQTKLTWFLLLLAIGLFSFIYFFERKVPSTAERNSAPKVLEAVRPGDVVALEIALSNGGTVRAEQTNGTWFLTKPFYPADQSAIETFVTNLTQLRRFDRIPQHKVVLVENGQKSFGFDPPRATVSVQTSSNRFRFEIGATAPLTNNLYLRVEPSTDVILAQADLLQSLPRDTNDWRSEKLLHTEHFSTPFDRLRVRSGQRMFELARNPTNNLWQITRPIPARGDQPSIASLLDFLGTARISGFVADGVSDLERYGLQAPEVELVFQNGTNRVFAIEFGSSVTNNPNIVYARLIGESNVVTVPRGLVDVLKQPYKTYHDPRLVTFDTNSLDRITVESIEKYNLQLQPNGQWMIEGKEPILADAEAMMDFWRRLLSLRILDIVKEVPTDEDLQSLGLALPRPSFGLYEKQRTPVGVATNVQFTQLSFGTPLADRIYVRRSDETPVYVTTLAPLTEMPHQAFRMRDRQIWSFSTNDLVRITVTSAAGTNTAARSNGIWSTDPIVNSALEEAAFRLSRVRTPRWVAKGGDALRQTGIVPGSPMMELELKGALRNNQFRIQFGKGTLQKNVYATAPAITDGQDLPLVFEFPGEIYHLLMQNLPAAK